MLVFTRDLIKLFSKISMPLCTLLEKDSVFSFYAACVQAFQELKLRLISIPIIVAPNWSLPCVMMYDANDFAIGAVLEQRRNKISHSMYYASRTLTGAQLNYTDNTKIYHNFSDNL